MMSRDRLALAFCASLVLAAAGCAGAGDSSGFVLSDSAGIPIAESSAPLYDDADGWQLGAQPLLEIGALEGEPEYQLYQVRGALRLSDGRIAVANAGANELRFYDAAGVYMRASGRKGGGPGEFENIGLLTRLGADSLLVWDWGNARASVFDGRGDFVRSFRLQNPGGEENAFPRPRGLLGDRSLLAQAGGIFTPSSGAGVNRDSVLYRRYDLDGEPIDTVGHFPGPEYYVQTIGENGIAVSSLPLGRSPELAFNGAGFYYGSSDSYEIGYYGPDGTLQRIVRKAVDNRPVTADDIEAVKQARLEGAGEQWRERIEKMFNTVPIPETFPAYSRLLTDADNNLWVQDPSRPDQAEVSWSVFDSQGRWLTIVVMPARFTPYQIGRDFVLGSIRDELEVEYVRLYELDKTPASTS